MDKDISILLKYFPDITNDQKIQFVKLGELYTYWNGKINVISRKDISLLYEHHILHSLSIAKLIQFKEGTKIIDVGTGGGFPGIPLAILYPHCSFHLIDSIAKKIKVVSQICNSLKLGNVSVNKIRSEKITEKYDFITGRTVTSLPKFMENVKHLVKAENFNDRKNGVLYLKGGNFSEELDQLKNYRLKQFNISGFFEEQFFYTKKIVHIF